jgi:hypothetical protein
MSSRSDSVRSTGRSADGVTGTRVGGSAPAATLRDLRGVERLLATRVYLAGTLIGENSCSGTPSRARAPRAAPVSVPSGRADAPEDALSASIFQLGRHRGPLRTTLRAHPGPARRRGWATGV